MFKNKILKVLNYTKTFLSYVSLHFAKSCNFRMNLPGKVATGLQGKIIRSLSKRITKQDKIVATKFHRNSWFIEKILPCPLLVSSFLALITNYLSKS